MTERKANFKPLYGKRGSNANPAEAFDQNVKRNLIKNWTIYSM